MFRKIGPALLAGVSLLAVATPSSAYDSRMAPNEPRVVYSPREPAGPAPIRVAYPERNTMGGGFIEFLFSGGQSGNMPYQQPQYREPAQDPRAMGEPAEREVSPARQGFDPKYEKQMVSYSGREAAGTIVIDTPNKFLYLVQGNGQAMRYGIGVGRPGFTWSGVKRISAKKEWPAWTPPAEMLKRRPDLPRHMEGGPENPLGARAMYLGSTLYRIHGSNEPWTIGTNVSSGCIRMRNQDVIDLYGRVNVGTRVVVL
jgi:lipoprotein-anchoring transpeptidase ErfK/SrfK